VSLVQGKVDNGPVLLIKSGATAHLHDFKVENTSTVATPRALESDTTETYVHEFAVLCASGEGVRITSTQPTGSRFFASQLRISNCQTGVSCRGGEVFLVNYDCESLTTGVSIDAAHGGFQWLGGRANSFTTGLRIQANCESIVVHGITAINGADFLLRSSGTVNRANVVGCTVANMTRGINWSATLPTGGLSIVGNNFNMATPFTGFTHTTARVNSKANTRDTALMSETPIVP
jgi:hypothetical protein